jgi:hypothetical protein
VRHAFTCCSTTSAALGLHLQCDSRIGGGEVVVMSFCSHVDRPCYSCCGCLHQPTVCPQAAALPPGRNHAADEVEGQVDQEELADCCTCCNVSARVDGHMMPRGCELPPVTNELCGSSTCLQLYSPRIAAKDSSTASVCIGVCHIRMLCIMLCCSGSLAFPGVSLGGTTLAGGCDARFSLPGRMLGFCTPRRDLKLMANFV